jgi:hypothetical protein
MILMRRRGTNCVPKCVTTVYEEVAFAGPRLAGLAASTLSTSSDTRRVSNRVRSQSLNQAVSAARIALLASVRAGLD